MEKFCNCETVGAVARDMKSTCMQCGGIDAYKKSELRIDFKMSEESQKYAVRLTYEEQAELIKRLSSEKAKYGAALERIANLNAMDYEYKAWAKQALDT